MAAGGSSERIKDVLLEHILRDIRGVSPADVEICPTSDQGSATLFFQSCSFSSKMHKVTTL